MRCPKPDPQEDHLKIMIFANHELLGLLKLCKLDVYVHAHAMFDCVPCPFTQCLIFMIYYQETSFYVPLVYALMNSECKEAYWHVFDHMAAKFFIISIKIANSVRRKRRRLSDNCIEKTILTSPFFAKLVSF